MKKQRGIGSKLRSIFKKSIPEGQEEFNINKPETVTPEQIDEPLDNDKDGKRAHARHLVKLSVSVTSEHNFYTGFSENISEGGIFVATHDPLPKGEKVELKFTLPSGKEVDVTGEVRWIRDQNVMGDAMPGMGIRFVDLSDEARLAIESFLKKRDPLFHDDEL